MARAHVSIEDLHVGWRYSWRRTVVDADFQAAIAFCGDQGGYHVDEAFAVAAGFRGLIAPGLLQTGMVASIGGHLNLLAHEITFRYLKPVYAGDALEASCQVVAIEAERRRVSLHAEITNQDGEIVLTAEVAGYMPDPAWGVPAKPPPVKFQP